MADVDDVIVGGGSAGITLATRLTEACRHTVAAPAMPTIPRAPANLSAIALAARAAGLLAKR